MPIERFDADGNGDISVTEVRDALDRFDRSDVPTPAWARARSDDLDPAVGREIGLFDDITPDDEIHAPLDELDEQHGSRRHASTD